MKCPFCEDGEFVSYCDTCEGRPMKWIKCSDIMPSSYTDVLVTDGERQWVASTFNNLEIFLASHPDHGRQPANEFGAPFITNSIPKYWMLLPNPPEE